MATAADRTTARRRHGAASRRAARSTLRANIVRLVPGKTRLPVGPEPELESVFAA